MAPTGVAAIQVDSMTIHTALGMPIGHVVPAIEMLSLKQLKKH